jgi:hypothetical protein
VNVSLLARKLSWLREEKALKVSENEMLRRIIGSEGNEVTRHINKMHKGGRRNLYASQNVIRTVKTKGN